MYYIPYGDVMKNKCVLNKSMQIKAGKRLKINKDTLLVEVMARIVEKIIDLEDKLNRMK